MLKIAFSYKNGSTVSTVLKMLPKDMQLKRTFRVTAGRITTTFGFFTRIGNPFIRSVSLQTYCEPPGT